MSRTIEQSPRGRRDATTAACPVFLDQRVNLVGTANRVSPACPDHQAFLVAHRWRSAQSNHRHLALHVHRANPDHPVHLETQVMPARTAHQAIPERTAETDRPAHLDPTDHQATQAKTARRDHPATRPPQFHPRPAMLDPLARLDLPALQARTALQDQTELQAQLATRDQPALLAHPETMVLLATRDHLAPTDPQERRVFARNIAPPTAVSSSRMAQGDKHCRESIVCYIDDEKPVFFMSIACVFLVFFVLFVDVQQFQNQNMAIIASHFGAFCKTFD